METIQYVISIPEANQRLDKFMCERIPHLSRVLIQQLILDEKVLVNDRPAKVAYRLNVGDLLSYRVPPPETFEVMPETIPLDILYEDEHFVAINKAAGMVVHPGYNNWEGTLVNALLARYPQVAGVGEEEKLGIVHRLDKNTSGVILAALNPEVRLNLMEQFRLRRVDKVYLALVDGQPPTPTGRIEAPIGRDPRYPNRRAISEAGKPSVTLFYAQEAFLQHSFVEVHIETGRTHQIRVHMAFINCPVVGDTVYGQRKPSLPLDRLFLHAHSIRIQHPITGEALQIKAPLPDELTQIIEQLRAERDALG